MKNIIYIYILHLIFISCETTLDIDLPKSDPKLVINSYLIADQFWDGRSQFALVSNSIQGLESVDNYIYTDSIPVVNNATVTIKEIHSNTHNNIIIEYPLEFDNLCYCYTNPGFTPSQNKTYELNVNAPDFPPINAIERVPEKPIYSIANFELLSEIDEPGAGDLCRFNIKLQDVPNEKNYYKLKIYIQNTAVNEKGKPCIYEVNDPSFLIPINRYDSSNSYYRGRYGYFTDDLFQGDEKDLYIEVEKPKGIYNQFYIEITSYSENLYNFNLTRREQNRNSDNFLFNSEAIFIQSNINNGYGIFGARATSKKLYLPTYFPINGWYEY